MRFWLCASGAFLLQAGAQTTNAPAQKPSRRRANEMTLARLRPGRDTVQQAAALYKKPSLVAEDQRQYEWDDVCRDLILEIESANSGEISTIRVMNGKRTMADCFKTMPRTKWRTSRDIAPDDPEPKVLEVYGEPTSRSPSTKNGQPLELLYYAFDWAGPDVPQVMEVVCTVPKNGTPGRVVEITLAAGSL